MLKQLSIYAENRKGTMQSITQVLADEGINIWGSCTNDGAEYGINRMVVSEPEKAMEALEGAGYLCRLTSVIGVELEDEVGNLNRLLKALAESNININYIYVSKLILIRIVINAYFLCRKKNDEISFIKL